MPSSDSPSGNATRFPPELFLYGKVSLFSGDCLEVLATLPDNSIDSCVTDPPYHLTSIVKRFGADNAAPAKAGKTGAFARASAGFMGKKWDGGDIAFRVELWAQVLRVLKPGAHLMAFSGTRTYHRMACAIEDAGFEIRDQAAWVYGSGFPKSHDVSKGIDKQSSTERKVVGTEKVRDIRNGNGRGNGDGINASARDAPVYMERDLTEPASDDAKKWEGWGTALKPAWEPICLARKPLEKGMTVAQNVLKWGTGAINVGACRVGTEILPEMRAGQAQLGTFERHNMLTPEQAGRWPANLAHDGSPEVVAAFPAEAGAFAPVRGTEPSNSTVNIYGDRDRVATVHHGDTGSAARFFYTAKADAVDRIGSKHPTVKPVDLIQWCERLVTPHGGIILDAFAGTGTTGEAAWREGFRAYLIERETEYQEDIRRRMRLCLSGPDEKSRESIKAKMAGKPQDHGPLFGGEN